MNKLNIFGLLAVLALGCGSDDEETCNPMAQSGCEEGLVCELVTGGAPACFAPVLLRGQVFDLLDDTPIAGARIVALDVNGAAVTSVAVSDAAGNYVLEVPSERAADGSPVAVDLTLRADAMGYQTFPSGIRQALPIDTGAAMSTETGHVVESSLTQIGLLAFEQAPGTAQLFGTVELPPENVGILVVAESAGSVHAAIAGRDGEYRIFNVAEGDYTVTAYAVGYNYNTDEASIAAGADVMSNLTLSDTATGTVQGAVQIVNAPGGSVTSVILVLASTFDELTLRGQSVPGLRAPQGIVEPNIEGEYLIEGVPAGDYFVLAAFENDDLVRDPDISIGGTSILNITVSPGETTVVEGFKVTEALEILSPGATGAEEISGTPDFSWKDDSSEDRYDIVVFDAFGELIWETSIDGVSGQDPSVTYAGPALESGVYYQFRVTSLKDNVPISRSEDLEGIFYLP